MNLKDELIKAASQATGIKEKTALVHRGLEELIRTAAYKRLIALGGADLKAKAAHRKRSAHTPVQLMWIHLRS